MTMDRQKATSFDVAILGGGPAGSLLARHLAARGFAVVLHTRTPKHHKHIEGLSPRAMDRLRGAVIETLPLVTAAALPRAAHWGGVMNRFNSEALVDRSAFDAALLQQARSAGVVIKEQRLSGPRSAADLNVRLVVEARGRQAPRHRVALRGPHTVALVRQYQGLPTAIAETILTAMPFGWIWAALPGDGSATVQLMLDAASETMTRARAEALFDEKLGQCPEITTLLQAAGPDGPLRARDAGALLADDLATPDYLRIGDAAAAIDPLAGHGLYEAIGSARAAEAVAATLLDRPNAQDAAIRFHISRTRDVFLRHARMGRDFYRLETRWPDQPFWQNRRDWPDNLPIHAPPLSQPARVVTMPANIDGYIEERPVIITADHPRGILSIAGVPLVPLMTAKPQMNEAALAAHFNVTIDNLRTAEAWLSHYGLSNYGPSAVPAR